MTGFSNSLKRGFVLSFEFTHLVDVCVVGERLVHVRNGEIQLVRDVSERLSAVDHPCDNVANANTRSIDSGLATEHIFITGETHTVWWTLSSIICFRRATLSGSTIRTATTRLFHC
jgi:hypothetical protein